MDRREDLVSRSAVRMRKVRARRGGDEETAVMR